MEKEKKRPSVAEKIKETAKRLVKDTTKNKKTRKEKKDLAPYKLELLFTIVNRNKAEFYADLIQGFEVNMQMTMLARGTADFNTLSLLGIEGSEKSVIISVIKSDRVKDALSLLEEKFFSVRNGKGIAYTVPLTSTVGVALYKFLCNNRKQIGEL